MYCLLFDEISRQTIEQGLSLLASTRSTLNLSGQTNAKDLAEIVHNLQHMEIEERKKLKSEEHVLYVQIGRSRDSSGKIVGEGRHEV
jgi:ACT domain-containing protein